MAGSSVENADAEPVRGVRLRVHVDQEHPLPRLRETRSKIDGGRRLADPALLICYRVYQ